jgi:hypothetical protein
MAGSALTSGYDLVFLVNANNFAATVESDPDIRKVASLGVVPVGPPAPGTLTFSPPLAVRFYRSASADDTFELDLSLPDARWTRADGTRSASLGSGRTLVRIPARLARELVPGAPLRVRVWMLPWWSTLAFIPADGRELPPGVTADGIRDGLRAALPSLINDIDLTRGGTPLTPTRSR